MQSTIKLYIHSVVVSTLTLALTTCGILLGYDSVTNITVFTLYALSIFCIISCPCGIYAVSSGYYKPRSTVIGSLQSQEGIKKLFRYYSYLCYFSISVLCASAGYFLLASTVLLSLIMIIALNTVLLDKIKELEQQSISQNT